MNVSLTVSNITFSFLDEEIDRVRSRTSQSPDNVPLVATGAMGSYIYNYEGATKTITITGTLIDANTTRTSTGIVKTIAEQKKWLEGLFAGQSTSIEFNSDFESETPDVQTGFSLPYIVHYSQTKVIGGTIEFSQIQGEVNQLPFIMNLVVGGS